MLPFGDLGWTGLRRPDRVFAPVLMNRSDGSGLLVPLCLTRGRTAVIGAYGYGFVQPIGDDTGLPAFTELAAALCEEMDLTAVSTMLPPAGVCPDLDAAAAGWCTTPGADTYVVRLDDGLKNAWSWMATSHQRNIRRAQRLDVRIGPGRRRHLPAVLKLYEATMEHAGLLSVYEPDDLAFLFDDEDRRDAVVMVAEHDGEVVAAEVTAVAGRSAYYMIGTVSARGRDLGAGHLTLWAAMKRLAADGVEVVDLGPSAGSGLDTYKRRWGSTTAPIRTIQFPGNSD
jgi:hypothetical protein